MFAMNIFCIIVDAMELSLKQINVPLNDEFRNQTRAQETLDRCKTGIFSRTADEIWFGFYADNESGSWMICHNTFLDGGEIIPWPIHMKSVKEIHNNARVPCLGVWTLLIYCMDHVGWNLSNFL